jgi:hypothetical protein
MIFKIFCRKIQKKIGVFDSKQRQIMQNFDHNIGFWEKRQFFRRKLSNIAENWDHNIDPRLGEFSPIGRWFTLVSFLIAKIIYFFCSASCVLILTKTGLGYIFSQTRLFTLFTNTAGRKPWERGASRPAFEPTPFCSSYSPRIMLAVHCSTLYSASSCVMYSVSSRRACFTRSSCSLCALY